MVSVDVGFKLLVLRWLPSGGHPILADGHCDHVIQLQTDDGCAPTRCLSANPRAIGDPLEMVRPVLPSGVKKRHDLARMWISPLEMVCLMAIAEAAGQPKIVLGVAAVRGHGNDVFDFERCEHEVLWAKAITAPFPSAGANAVAHLVGNVARHGATGARNPRRTASRSASALSSKPS